MFFHVFHTHARTHTVGDNYKLRVTTDRQSCDQRLRFVKNGLFQTLYRHKAIKLAVLCIISIADIGLNFSRLLPFLDFQAV